MVACNLQWIFYFNDARISPLELFRALLFIVQPLLNVTQKDEKIFQKYSNAMRALALLVFVSALSALVAAVDTSDELGQQEELETWIRKLAARHVVKAAEMFNSTRSCPLGRGGSSREAGCRLAPGCAIPLYREYPFYRG